MKIKISGVLSAPTAEVCAGSEIQLKAVTTSNNIIINAESSYFVGQDGKYEFNVYPGRYDVYIQFSAEAPQKVGRIGVYEDSQPGTLEEYLLIDNGGYFKPEALIQFEKDCAAAAASAAAAKSSEDASAGSASAAAASAAAARSAEDASADNASAAAGSAAAAKLSEDASAGSASAAAGSAAAAKSSEDASAGSASAAAGSAAAAKSSEDASAGSASAAAGSAAAAESAAERAAAAGGVDTSTLAQLGAKNTFTERQNFKEGIDVSTTGSQSSFDRLKVTGGFWSPGGSEFEGDMSIGLRTSTGAVKCYVGIYVYNGQRIKFYLAGASTANGIEFYEAGVNSPRGFILANKGVNRFHIYHKDFTTLLFDLERAEADGLKFRGKDRVEQTIYHSGYLPPAAVVAGELPAEVTQPVFYFDDAVEQLYFLNGDKKYTVTLTPA
ncbi:prophage tail fiber N-terminal domain-containing protein [Salmonella enterica]|nr:prophage tail fiber N-terminal domain-containing protein [Salmonella enterica]